MSDPGLRQALGRLLGAGVVLSALLLAMGLCGWLLLADGRPAMWLLNAGLLMLMATPVLGVAASLVEYVVERDWTFVLVTLVVLGILASTLLLALR